MSGIIEQARQLRGERGALAVFGLGVATMWLVLAGIVGAIAVSGDNAKVDTGELGGGDGLGAGDATSSTTPGAIDPATGQPAVIDPATGQPVVIDPATGQPVPGQPAPGPGAPAPDPGAPIQSPTGGDTTGLTNSTIKIGVHAPITFSGVPLNLAEDPIKGIETYAKFINDNGGISGRKIVLDIQDDRFDAEGARNSANSLINDHKNFMVSGTLGIDQVAIVAAEAAKRGVPYTAAGGDESNPIPGMFQIAGNYTTHVLQLADFMGQDPKYKGKRVGILVSNSQFIKPVAEDFKKALEANGLTVSAIVENEKPAANPDYNGYILEFRRNNTEVVVPLTDPLTTQQIVQRCAAGAACGWTYSFSNFAHDSDTALALFVPTWATQKVRGLSSACYYTAPEVDGPNCANMRVAREQWIAAHGQSDWDSNGSGGAAGYQIIAMLKGALAAPGADLSRQRFTAALSAYSGYADLISGPITFAGSSNTMHGATKMTVLEAQTNHKFKMITPGLVDGF